MTVSKILTVALVLFTILGMPWVAFNVFGWTMTCAFGVATDAEYAACRRVTDYYFGVRIIPALLVWSLLLVALIRQRRRDQ